MFQVFERAHHHRPELWAAVDCDGKLQALFTPVQVRLRHEFLSRFATRAIAYGSVLSEPGATGDHALRELLTAYQRAIKWQVLFVELRNLCDLTSVQPVLGSRGFVHEEYLNYLIDLNQSPEEFLKRLGARTRKNIRQGLKKGNVCVSEITDKKDIARSYRLIQKSYSVAGVPLADQSLFDATFDVLHPLGMCKFWVAHVNGTDVAASVELLYKDVMYGWYGGVDRRFAQHMPGELLMWHILTWGIEKGYRVYDFGGAGKPGEKYGVRDFKSKFGGALVAYGRNRYAPDPFRWKLVEASYRLYRRGMAFQSRLRAPVEIQGAR